MAALTFTSTTGSGFLETDFDQLKGLLEDGTYIVDTFDIVKDGWSIAGTPVTTTAAELNKLDGVTTTTAELNYVAGVTSSIQDQIDAIGTVDLTLTVGTTGSNADYECDGADDDVQIQAAIDAADALGGGTITILQGTYVIEAQIDMAANVHIVGMGWDNTILQQPSGTLLYQMFKGIQVDNWSIRNLKIDMNRTVNVTTHGWGIVTWECDYVVIEDVWVKQPLVGGITFTCYDPAETLGPRGDPSKYCKAVRCRVTDKSSTQTGDMLSTEDAFNCGFVDCVVDGTNLATDNGIGLYGIVSSGTPLGARGNYAIGCTVTNSANGINVENSDSSVVSGCVAFGNSRAGINVSSTAQNAAITGCTCYDNEDGINIDSTCTDITVTGCSFFSNDDNGAYIGGDHTTFTGNNVNNNQDHGIYVLNADFCNISDNNIWDNDTGTGTFFSAILSQTCENIIIKGNNIYNSSADGQYRGIYVTGAANHIIVSNNIVDNMDNVGVEIKTTIAYAVVSNNIVTNCGSDGIALNGVTYSSVSNNVLANNGAYGLDYASGTNTGTVPHDNVYHNNSSGDTNP